MNAFARQNHYEILEVSPEALPVEIRNAYRQALALYEDHPASYSFFSKGEREAILGRIEEAYRTLIHPERRADYDRSLRERGLLHPPEAASGRPRKPVAIYDFHNPGGPSALTARPIAELRTRLSQSATIQALLARESISGADLRTIREALAVSLDQIAHQTRIRTELLQAIEAEDRALLPPRVYLQGFIKAYARCLELDAQAVSRAYLGHLEKGATSDPGGA